MLQIVVPETEQWDAANRRFIYTKKQTLSLEHSLVSLSKWESRWNIPFLSKDPKTDEQTIDYIRCMTLTQNVDPDVYHNLSDENILQVKQYIDLPMTATVIKKEKHSGSNSFVTAEIIYYWMVAFNIPFECQKWHLNRLLTLIEVCDQKSKPAKKMGKNAIFKQNVAINAARRKQFNSKG
jgi:hypothetical protein